MSAYIVRINAVNPIINAIVHKNFQEAINEAQRIDNYLERLDKNSDEFRKVILTDISQPIA